MLPRALALAVFLIAGAAHADPPATRPKAAIEHPKRPVKPVVPRLTTRAPPVKAPPTVKAPTPKSTAAAPKKAPPVVVRKPPAPKPEPPEARPEPRRRRSPTGEDEARDPLLPKR